MRKVTLNIESPDGRQAVALEDEISVGRTSLARVTVNDASLSRVHATFFIENEEIWVIDENSTNGTFVKGERVSPNGKRLADGDEILLGNDTRVFIEIIEQRDAPTSVARPAAETSQMPPAPVVQPSAPAAKANLPLIPLVAGGSAFLIIFITVIVVLILQLSETEPPKTGRPTPQIRSGALIPVRVIDPLGGEDPDDLDDLIASWEGVEEKELDTSTVDEVKTTAPESTELVVPIAFFEKQKSLYFAARNSPTGNDPPGTQIPREVYGDGVIKQKAKLAEMLRLGYRQPMDFADLAQKRLDGELIELPIATPWYFLEVGGSAGENPFTAFSFEAGNAPIAPNTPKYQSLAKLAENFGGQKYDLNNGRDRRQIRIRLLRMFHPRAKPILEELAKAYNQKFNRPLRVTSLTRSMDYQISLNATNPNSFKVRGAGSLPPHTSGCAFDLSRKHLTAEEQNFVMAKLAEMENRGVLDALREGGANACFHVFIYPDGKPPKM